MQICMNFKLLNITLYNNLYALYINIKKKRNFILAIDVLFKEEASNGCSCNFVLEISFFYIIHEGAFNCTIS